MFIEWVPNPHLEEEEDLPAVQVRVGLEDAVREQPGERAGQTLARVERRDSLTQLAALIKGREVVNKGRGKTGLASGEHCSMRPGLRDGATGSHSQTRTATVSA